MEKKILKWTSIGLAIFLFVVLVWTNSCSVVHQRERGVNYTFGRVEGDVIMPGVVWHTPFVTQIKKYSIVPKTYKVDFQVGNDQGAITKDLQTVAATIVVRYNYDETRIMDIAMRWGDSMIEQAMQTRIISSVKEVVGQYTIYELIEKQAEITSKVSELVKNRMSEFPILVTTVDITNWSWDDRFNEQIRQTAERTQQIKTAQQNLIITETDAKKQVAEAQAALEAERLNAEAARVRADAELYTTQQLSKAATMKQAEWRHEEEMKRLEKWNGQYVPNNVYHPIEIDTKGGIKGY